MTDLPIHDRVPQIVPSPAVAQARVVRPAGAPAAGMTGRDILQILRKRKWLIILSTAIATFLAVGATVVWLKTYPLYTASALLRVDVPKASELSTGQTLYGMDIMDRIKMTHARLATIDPILQAAGQKEELRRTAWFSKGDQSQVVRRLRQELSVAPVTGTNFVMISMTGPVATDLPGIVNSVAEAYVDYNRTQLQGGYTTDSGRLSNERIRYEGELQGIRREARVARPENIPNIESQTNAANMAVQTLYQTVLELEAQQARLESGLRVVMAMQQNGTLAQSPEVLQAVEYDPAVRTLRMAELNYINEQDNLIRKLGPENPRMKDYDTRLASIRRQLAEKSQQVAQAQAQAAVQGRQAAFDAMTIELTQTREKYHGAVAMLRDLQDNLSRLRQLAASEEQLNGSIARIDSRLLELRLLSMGQQDVQIAAAASTPDAPSMPRWKVTVPAGFLLGLMFGLGMAFLLELIDTSIKSPSDIARKVDLPLLGMVPHAEDLDEEVSDLRLAFMTNPNSLLGEAFRQIYTCLLFSGPAEQRRSVLVTSPSPSDGRTTVAMNLAAAAARAGRKVLLVDTNFRQPMVHQLIPQCPRDGLSNVLSGQAQWPDVVCHVEGGLYAMPAGILPPNPAELLASENMRRLIAQMSGQYDQLIFDGAPVMLVTDPLGLSTMVDGVVLVVRAGQNTHGLVQRSRDTLNRVGARILGTVLNAVRVTPGGYLRKNYEAYYDYHEQREGAPKQS